MLISAVFDRKCISTFEPINVIIPRGRVSCDLLVLDVTARFAAVLNCLKTPDSFLYTTNNKDKTHE